MVASSIAVVMQLVEIVVAAMAQKLIEHLIVPELVDKALIADSSAVAKKRIGSVVVGRALRMIVFAHREQFDVHILG